MRLSEFEARFNSAADERSTPPIPVPDVSGTEMLAPTVGTAEWVSLEATVNCELPMEMAGGSVETWSVSATAVGPG